VVRVSCSKRVGLAFLACVVVAMGLTACADEDGGSRAAAAPTSGGSARANDRALEKCLTRAGARAVKSRADLRFLKGTSTEGDRASTITNGVVSSGPGGTDVEWMTVSDGSRWRVYSRSYEPDPSSPDYEGMWQRVLRASPDLPVLAVKRTGSRASFTAARRCIGSAG